MVCVSDMKRDRSANFSAVRNRVDSSWKNPILGRLLATGSRPTLMKPFVKPYLRMSSATGVADRHRFATKLSWVAYHGSVGCWNDG
jgi:hypothetical protein